jgi:hypothetical protein
VAEACHAAAVGGKLAADQAKDDLGCCCTRFCEGSSMLDRSESPAYAVLPEMARRVFAAIELTIGDGTSACVSFFDFSVDHRISAKSIKPALKLLEHLGLIEIEMGPQRCNEFRLSDR